MTNQLKNSLTEIQKHLELFNESLSREEIFYLVDELKSKTNLLVSQFDTISLETKESSSKEKVKIPFSESVQPKLLIVDDDQDTQKLLSFTMKRKGFEVISKLNPIEAINEIEQINPDVILLDLMMPNMTGFEFLEKIKNSQIRKNFKIVVGSARNFSQDRINVLKAGADDFISKPYNIAETSMRLHNIIGR